MAILISLLMLVLGWVRSVTIQHLLVDMASQSDKIEQKQAPRQV